MNAVANEATKTRETNRVAQRSITPHVNIIETKDGYTLTAELPGVSKEGVEITVEDNELTIVGHRASNGVPGEVLYRESSDADYRRVFEIDPSIDAGKIVAKVEQGMLTLQLPFSERVKPRKIAITA
jgi:HSP20 family protein